HDAPEKLNSGATGPDMEHRLKLVGDRDLGQGVADEELAAGIGIELKMLGEIAVMSGANRPVLGNQVDRRIGMLSLPGDLGSLEAVVKARGRLFRLLLAALRLTSQRANEPGRNHHRDPAVIDTHRLETSLYSANLLRGKEQSVTGPSRLLEDSRRRGSVLRSHSFGIARNHREPADPSQVAPNREGQTGTNAGPTAKT